jgi:hypothetical protein
MYQERQMSLEERKGVQYGEYMGAATEQAKAGTERTNVETEGLRGSIKTGAELQQLQVDVQRYLKEDIEATTQGEIDMYGSKAAAKKAVLQQKADEISLRMDTLRAQLNEANSATSSNNFNLIAAKQKNDFDLLDRTTAIRAAWGDLAENPEAQKVLDKAFADNSLEDGTIDTKGLMAVRNTLNKNANLFKNPVQAARVDKMFGTLSDFAVMQETKRASAQKGLLDALYSEDQKVVKIALKNLGVDNMKELNEIDPMDKLGRPRKVTGMETYLNDVAPLGWLSLAIPHLQAELVKGTGIFNRYSPPVYGEQPGVSQPVNPTEKQPKQTGYNPAGMEDYPLKRAFKKVKTNTGYPMY